MFKKGLFKDYQLFREELSTLKGKIELNDSLLKRDKLICEYFDISFSNIKNSIIKATLLLILSQKNIHNEERKRALIFYRRLKDIKQIKLSASCYKKLNINRHNKHYKSIIELSELIFNNLRLIDTNGESLFSSFMINLNTIYERFLLKALQRRLKTEHVLVNKSKKIGWAETSDDYLPQLEPDIYIKGKAIVDAKYYKSPLTQNDNFISSHLSQLNLYLDAYNLTNGFLVYPEPDSGQINSVNKIRQKKLVVYTIPLNKEIVDLNTSLDILTKLILSE